MDKLIFVILFFYCTACSDTKPELSEQEASMINNKEYLKDVKIIYSDSGHIQIIIKAPVLLRHLDLSDPKDEFIHGFFAEFYDSQEKLINTLASKYAIRQSSLRKTIMQDSVVFQSIHQETMKTSELIWDENNGKLYTDKYVRIIRKNEIIQGFGFETDEKFKVGSIKSIDALIPSEKLIDKELTK